MEPHEAVATSAKSGETQQKHSDFNHGFASAPPAPPPLNFRPRWLSKSEQGLVPAKPAPTSKPAPLPVRHDVPKVHQETPIAMATRSADQVQARPQGISLALPRRDGNVILKDVAGEQREANQELPADKGKPKLKPEQSYFALTKGPFRTQAINDVNIPFALQSGDNEDEDMAVNACVVTAAVVLIFLTIFLIFFLMKSSQSLTALERTTASDEELISPRPRGFEATDLPVNARSASDRYSSSSRKSSHEVMPDEEAVGALTESAVFSVVTNGTNI
ncbi:uncharacterized protein [Dermacentor albipictus]|uniref:uncharacterized protein n=1 Tax=Dermacentor albipictus TaxID=60249 RepID=UPI0031FDA20D